MSQESVTAPDSGVRAGGRGFFAETFRSLAVWNFRSFFIGQLISNTGNWLTMVALTLLVLHRTHSGLAVGLLTACQFGPILVLSAWAGSIADRSDKHRLLFVTQAGEMAQSCALAMLAFLPAMPIGSFFGVAVVGGVLLAFDNPLRRSFVPEMVPKELIPNAVMLYSTLVNLSRIFGPTLAGALITTLGYGWCFAIDAASYVAVIVALACIRRSELRTRPPVPRERGRVRAGFAYVRSKPELRISFIMLAVVGTLGYNFSVVFPLFVEVGLGGSDATYTFVYAVFSVGALIGALGAARRNDASMTMIVVGCATFGVAMAVLTFVPNVGFAYPVVLMVGVTSIVYMTSTTAIVQVRARASMHGRVLALQTVLLIGTTPIGGPILGAVSDRFGARAPVAIGAVVAMLTAAWGFSAMRRHADALSRPPDTDQIEAVSTVDPLLASPGEETWPVDPQPGDPKPV